MYVNNQSANQIEFLASSHYINFTKQISDSGVTADANGKKIVPAGTVHPANDDTAEGIVFHDVDVTHGPAAGAVMVEGYVLEARLPEAPVQLAKDAMTEIKFR